MALVLGLAADRNNDAIGLFLRELLPPQHLAAKGSFTKIENIGEDTKGLDEQYELILEVIQKQKEPPSFRPGIG